MKMKRKKNASRRDTMVSGQAAIPSLHPETPSPSRSSPWRYLLLPIFFGILLYSGFQVSTLIAKPLASELQAVNDALSMAAGNSTYGIVAYSHYPNGPSYILLPFVAMGLHDLNDLRLIPLVTAALAFTLVLWALLSKYKGVLLTSWCVLGLLFIYFQPGVIGWAGRLHEFSYALSLTLVIATCGLLVANATPWFIGLGFAAAWIGYDWLPVQIVTAFASRLLFHWQRSPLGQGAILAAKDGLWASSGAFSGILAHLFQNTLFHGEATRALKDFFGAMGARMGTESATALNSQYTEELNRYSDRMLRLLRVQELTPGLIVRTMTSLFIKTWINFTLLFLFVPFVLSTIFNFQHFKDKLSGAAAGRKWLAIVIPIVVMVIGANIWFVLVPYHAIHHFHFLPRHYYSIFFIALFIPLMMHGMQDNPGPKDRTSIILRSTIPALSAFLGTLFTLAGLYIHAVKF